MTSPNIGKLSKPWFAMWCSSVLKLSRPCLAEQCVTWRSWAPRHMGYCPAEGRSRGSSFPFPGGSDPPHLYRSGILILWLSLVVGRGVLSGRRFEDGMSRECRERRTTRIGEQGVLVNPGVPPLVRSPAPSSNVKSPRLCKERGCSEVRTAAREKELSGLPVPWNGGFGLVRPRADASLGLASRADSTLHTKRVGPYITGSRSEWIPAGSE